MRQVRQSAQVQQNSLPPQEEKAEKAEHSEEEQRLHLLLHVHNVPAPAQKCHGCVAPAAALPPHPASCLVELS